MCEKDEKLMVKAQHIDIGACEEAEETCRKGKVIIRSGR